jgi:hypothetical protein
MVKAKYVLDISCESLPIDVARFFRFGRSNANEYALFSRDILEVSTFRLMVVFLCLVLATVGSVYGAYATRSSRCLSDSVGPNLRSCSVQMGDVSLLDIVMDA